MDFRAAGGRAGDLGPSERPMFWLRNHGALAGRSIAAVLKAGTPLTKLERLTAGIAAAT